MSNKTTKRCTCCKTNKPIELFCKNKSRPDGLANKCRSCKNEARRIYGIKNKEKIREYQNSRPKKPYQSKMTKDYKEQIEKWRIIKEEKLSHKQFLLSIREAGLKPCSRCMEIKSIDLFPYRKGAADRHSGVCRDCTVEQKKRLRSHNTEKYREYARKNNNTTARRESIRAWRDKNRDRINMERRERIKKDPHFQFRKNMSGRIHSAIKGITKKSDSIEKLIGCSIKEARNHIEKQFVDGMSWDNYGCKEGQWSIDHIKPCASFDLSDPKQQAICFNFKNTRPLWHIDNQRKGAKLLYSK